VCARKKRGTEYDGDIEGGRDIRKRKIKGVGQGVRRTGPTTTKNSRTTAFQRHFYKIVGRFNIPFGASC